MFTSPLFLGFDHLEQMLERASKTSSDGYPPYNIEQTGPTGLRITLAVAGFTMDDLQITQEDNQLVIRGRQTDDSQGRIFLHRGIAARQFQRAFVLAEGIEVKGAWLDNGLLHIDLARPQPEPRVKTIQINRAEPAADGNGSGKDNGWSRANRSRTEQGPDRHDGAAKRGPNQQKATGAASSGRRRKENDHERQQHQSTGRSGRLGGHHGHSPHLRRSNLRSSACSRSPM